MEGLMHVATWYRGTPDQSSGNSENKYQLARSLTLPNFVAPQQEVQEIFTVKNFCSHKGGPKFTKIGSDLLCTNAAHHDKFHCTQPNDVQEKC